jgi:pimeloyl-ACP methyl ester carboxylesterase
VSSAATVTVKSARMKVRSKDGTAIAFDRSGEGPPLILVLGAFNDRVSGTPLAKVLLPELSVFTYDRRGRGESGDTAPYAVEREVEDLEALITEAGGSAFVFGHSSGAALALEAARTLAITKLALYEPPFIVDDSRPPLPGDYVARLQTPVSAGRRGDAVEYFMTNAAQVPAEVIAGMRKDASWAALEGMAHTLAYDGAAMGDTMSGKLLPTKRWASVRMPTLVMNGSKSPAYQKNSVRALVAALPNATRRTLEGQDHGAAPEVLAPVLKEFFR